MEKAEKTAAVAPVAIYSYLDHIGSVYDCSKIWNIPIFHFLYRHPCHVYLMGNVGVETGFLVGLFLHMYGRHSASSHLGPDPDFISDISVRFKTGYFRYGHCPAFFLWLPLSC